MVHKKVRIGDQLDSYHNSLNQLVVFFILRNLNLNTVRKTLVGQKEASKHKKKYIVRTMNATK